jgi:hypothetical protein
MTLRDDIRETILAEAMTSGFQMLRRDNFSGIELEDEQNETVPNWRYATNICFAQRQNITKPDSAIFAVKRLMSRCNDYLSPKNEEIVP